MNKILLCTAIALALHAGSAGAGSPMTASARADSDARVEVSNVRGSITVTAWDRPEVAVSGTLGEGSVLKFEGEGARVSVRIESPDSKGWSWWGGRGPSEDTRLEVSVPRAAALDVDAVSADVRVEGIAGSREVVVETVSGDLRLAAEATRQKISSVSGDVEMRGSSQRTTLESVSGDLTAEGLSGEIDLETVSGDARVRGGAVDRVNASSVSGTIDLDIEPRGAARVRGETMSGEFRLRVPGALGARIEVDSFSGDIDSDFGTVEEEEHGPGRKLRATAGDGAATISVESFSGDVEIRKRQ
jgi:hypothetical protein